jgi:hypothetical protein
MSERVKQIYISGPITGRDKDEYLDHFNEVEWALKRHAEDAGVRITVFNPASYFAVEYDEPPAYHMCMRKCIEELTRCDGIALLEGWEKSSGAQMELRVSQELKIPLVYAESTSRENAHEFPAEAFRYICAHSSVFNLSLLDDRFLRPDGFDFVDGK